MKAVFIPRTDGRPGASFPMFAKTRRRAWTVWGIAGRTWRVSGRSAPRPFEAWEVEIEETRNQKIAFLVPIQRLIYHASNSTISTAFYSYRSGDCVKIWVDGVMYYEDAVRLIDRILPLRASQHDARFGEKFSVVLRHAVLEAGVKADRQSRYDVLATAELPREHWLFAALKAATEALDAIEARDERTLRAVAEQIDGIYRDRAVAWHADIFRHWVIGAQNDLMRSWTRTPEAEWLASLS